MLAADLDDASDSLPEITFMSVGAESTAEHRLFFYDFDLLPVSPWHNIPLHTSKELSPAEKWMVIEVPKATSWRYSVATSERLNPIGPMLDRHATDVQLYSWPVFWNHGFLPQTWEDAMDYDPLLGKMLDDGPLDVVEIGTRTRTRGEVVRVKVLGAVGFVDQGFLDWKLITIDVEDDIASLLNDVEDIEAYEPQIIVTIQEWFRWNEVPGKKVGDFAFGGDAVNREKALALVDSSHERWMRLRRNSDADAEPLWVRDPPESPYATAEVEA